MNLILLLEYFLVFVLGLCIGSFLNCVVYRLETKKSLKGRSFCPKCKKQLCWQDLIPVFSFVFLGGKCRNCKQKISLQYPLVELATGIVFLLLFNFEFVTILYPSVRSIIEICFLFYVFSALIAIFIYDLKHYEIPDKILIPAIVITLFYGLFFNFYVISSHLLAAFAAFSFFFIIFWFSKGQWMGFGDAKFAILMGLLLGFPNTVVALFLAFFFGAIIGVILMIFEKKGLKSEIPFGPFLIFGVFLALIWGPKIISWYLNFLI